MIRLIRPSSLLLARIGLGMLVLGLVVALVWTAADLRGQAPGQAAPGKPPKKKRAEEEEEETTPPKRKVVRVEEEEPAPKKPARPNVPLAGDLKQAAAQARHPAVKALFRDLAVPHDMVVYFGHPGVRGEESGRVEFVEPIAEYLADEPTRHRGPELTLHRLDSDWKPVQPPQRPTLKSIKYITPYERLAQDAVRSFLKERFDDLPAVNAKHLSRYDMLVAAEQALAAVLRFHESAREQGLRRGDGWDAVESDLRKYLLEEVMLKQLETLAAGRNWDQVLALTRRLAETYTREADQERIARPVAELLRKSFDDPTGGDATKREARKRLHELEVQFPGSPVFRPISDGLRENAQRLLDAAKSLVGEDRDKLRKDPEKLKRVLELLRQAEETWPQLPGLHTYRLELDQTHPILHVGVRGQLPKYLSPALASTDTESRAVEMLFESLVKMTLDESGTFHYEMGLAEGRPRVVPLGRQFRLPRNALWSNGEELNSGDIRYTVGLLQGKRSERSSPWGELLDNVEVKGDPFQVTVRMRQGFLDPLSLMTFKVLPQKGRERPDTEEFAKKPVSSGPFRFDRTQSDERGREYAGFIANSSYASRAGKRGMPYIQEVRFYVYTDPLKELRPENRHLDMLLDLTAKEADSLRQQADALQLQVPLPVPPAVNRRIYFLAINQRKVPEANLRKALAHAINRELLLDNHFRGPLKRQVHRALNGPFPAGSWACNPALVNRRDRASLDLFDADLARTLSKQPAVQKALGGGALTLKYAEGDPAVEAAMTALRDQVKTATGIDLELVKLDPFKLREDVERIQDYDLAYYHYDFPDETYWLWPLLGPRAGGENFLNFRDEAIQPLLQEAMGHRDFAQVQKYVRMVHEILGREMPLIPLWQLDPLLAYHQDVKPVSLDPLLVFTDVEQWRLQRK